MWSEFSRIFTLEQFSHAPLEIALMATVEECAGLAARFAVVAVKAMRGKAVLEYQSEHSSAHPYARGELEAEIVQACVRTGQEFTSNIKEDFTIRFTDAEQAGVITEAEIELDWEAVDEFFYSKGALDIGEAVAQTLGLAINPYACAPESGQAIKAWGVSLEAPEEEAKPKNPFEALKKLL
jgi:uncharacterized metal-binding protein YceD (DUF177 family)